MLQTGDLLRLEGRNDSFDKLIKSYMNLRVNEPAPKELGALRAGAVFSGTQASEGSLNDYRPVIDASTNSGLISTFASYTSSALSTLTNQPRPAYGRAYDVKVFIKYVDLSNDYLCGYLSIANLTTEHPQLTTFFDGYVIAGPHRLHSFVTHRWNADESTDEEHWTKFSPFRAAASTMENLSLRQMDEIVSRQPIEKQRFVFMRWKEQFLVPDHTVDHVNGASYDGFYYVMFDLQEHLIEGFYYHESSERNQHLKLMCNDKAGSESFSFH